MNIQIVPIGVEEKDVLRVLIDEYQKEILNKEETEEYKYLNSYWQDLNRHPFFIKVDGAMAGFVLVNNYTLVENEANSISEFCIKKEFRNKGIGKISAYKIFDLFRGKWEIRELDENVPAQHFWPKVIGEYTNGNFKETVLDNEDWRGSVQVFNNHNLENKMNEIKIRKATLEDIPALSVLASRTYAETFGHTMTAPELKKALEETRSTKYFTAKFDEDRLLVAEENGELIGFIQFGKVAIKSVKATNQDRELKRIYIDKNKQGKGIGKKLMNAMLECSEMKSANKIYLDVYAENEKAIGLYVKYGFKVIGETDFTVDGQVIGKDTVMMLLNNVFRGQTMQGNMELILIDGGPASGKNTLGELITKKFQACGENTVLLDLDTYVEKLNPRWIWDDEDQKEKDQVIARLNAVDDIRINIQEGSRVIFIGERFFSKDDVTRFISNLKMTPPLQLFHLSVPYLLRKERLHRRGPHTLIDLEKDQKDRDGVKNWPGFVYENVNTPDVDATNLVSLIKENKGLLSMTL